MTKKLGIPKLGVAIVGYLFFALLLCSFTYLILVNTMPNMIHKLLVRDQSQQEIGGIVEELQGEITQRGLRTDSYIELHRWSRSYPYAQIQIQKDGMLIFDSGFEPENTMPIVQALDEAQGMGIGTFPLIFSDGAAELSISLYTGGQFIMLIKFAAFAAVIPIFLFIFVALLTRKLSYILRIADVVQCYEGGLLSERIAVEGTDELAALAENINRMAGALQAEIDRQTLLKEENAKLVSSLSHDIRTPLTSVISYLDIVRAAGENDQKNEVYLQIIRDKAEQIKALINSLFDHATEGGPSFEGQLTEVDGEEFITEIFEETEQLLKDAGCTVVISRPKAAGFTLDMNYFCFRRIWDNLFSNLQKYADKAEPVFLTAELEDGKFILRMGNSVCNSARGRVESNGIGLPNCRAMALRLGGSFLVNMSNEFYEAALVLPIK